MFEAQIVSLYFILVIIITFAAAKKKVNVEKVLFTSIFLTPVGGFIMLIHLKPPKKPQKTKYYKCKYCGFAFTEKNEYCPICGKNSEGKTKKDI